ncbi:MAG: acyl-ACP thioesterase [Spirochaetes bacterium]|nr:acyl-ACP thioesterase [Spirochaetota bacterium]MBU1080111.1 acyl-ACP thioesterase [Spirochaetota bacterium]
MINEVYEEPFMVRTWDVDEADRLTIAAAYNYCQEVAGNHARALGVGSEYMAANGLVWVLSRMSAVLDSRPAWGTRLAVRTWPRGTDRLFAMREYEIRDEAGAVVGRGRGAWLVVDSATFRPRRPEAIAEMLPSRPDLETLPGGALPVAAGEGLELAYQRAVAYSDIDYNGHMNNARYVQWIQDALDPAALSGAAGLRLDINYLAEMRQGKVAGVYRGTYPARPEGGWTESASFEGRTDEGQCSFRACLSLDRRQS